jgi:predicted transcriptional regulator
MRRKYRSVAGIMLDILECLNDEPEVLSKLATCANLPYDRAKNIVDKMVEKGYLERREDGKLEIKPQGTKALKKLRELKDMMEALGFKL